MTERWPQHLWVVRHGESAGNVARDRAIAAGLGRIEIVGRDVEVPLSARGREQGRALSHWFADLPEQMRPDVLLVSPYVRARATAELISEGGGVAPKFIGPCVDERLREREFGILDRLTSRGIADLYPEQVALRQSVGKFYHRPPGGESWCDVILRLRSALDTISLHYAGRRVLIVAHQVVVLCLRYLLENLSEAELMAIDAEGDVVNCGVTEYTLDPTDGPHGRLRLLRYNLAAHLRREGAPVTSAPDRPAAVK